MNISYSQISLLYGFENCDGKWYWKYHKGYEKVMFNRHFVIGDVYHQSVGLLYGGMTLDKVAKKSAAIFDARVAEDAKTCDVSINDRQELEKDKVAVKGMVMAYSKAHANDMKVMKHVRNEFDHVVPYPEAKDIAIRIKLDNIVEFKKKWYVHELKTVKSVDPRYVENRKYDFQTALYFHMYNRLFDKKGKVKVKDKALVGLQPVYGILYDAVQKPALRLKKGESTRQLLGRISEYYNGVDAVNKFYMEDFVPRIPYEDVCATIDAAIVKMHVMQEEDSFVKSYASCAWCAYKELCFHGGETKANIALYRKREKKK